jgi:tripartite-type tricarboxylate transporter receptor subunit TctC
MKKSFCLAAKAVALALSSLAVLPAVQAQDASNYPTRPIRLVVSQQAGGSSDTVARL